MEMFIFLHQPNSFPQRNILADKIDKQIIGIERKRPDKYYTNNV